MLPPSIIESLRQLRRRVLLPPAQFLLWAVTGIKGKRVHDLEPRVRGLELQLNDLRGKEELLRKDHDLLLGAMADRLDELRHSGAATAVQPGSFVSDEVFVLGSGPSMLELEAEERQYLQEQQTVAMNRYLIFWEKLGIWPKYVFLADMHPPAPRVLELTLARIFQSKHPPRLWLNRHYRVSCPLALETQFFYWDYFRGGVESWASSCDDHLYFWRGSLSSLLNLLTIKRVGRKIKLVGVDLGRPGTFFDDELRSYPELLPPDDVGRPMHTTAIPRDGKGGIQEKWPWMMEQIRRAGMDLVCCNPQSLLVEQGLCEYEPIIPGRARERKADRE
ncbi:MAG TPA: hypothetical protein VJ860_02110 [Polyangia bacterium]|nr:hypothetical protein [Polyangia bacterium]